MAPKAKEPPREVKIAMFRAAFGREGSFKQCREKLKNLSKEPVKKFTIQMLTVNKLQKFFSF